MKRFLLFFWFLTTTFLGAATDVTHPFLVHYANTEGLPVAFISCCCQDDFGRIWVGTREGVYYYSGSRFIALQNKSYLLNSQQSTLALAKDEDNCIWIATFDGVGYYDTFLDSFTVLEDLNGTAVSDIDITADGTVWLTSNEGLWKYTKSNKTVTKIKETDSLTPYRTCTVSQDRLVFTANDNRIYLYDTSSDLLTAVESDHTAARFGFVEYIGGKQVMVSDGLKTVCAVNFATGSTQTWITKQVIENKAELFCLMYHDGLCWIGTSYGLVIFDPATGTIERQFPDNLDESLLGGESIRCLFSDRVGNVWAGTFNGGLRAWTSFEEGFGRFVSNESPNSLKGNTVRAICDGPDGKIYIGSEEGYFCEFNPITKSFTDLTERSGIAYGTAITDLTRIGSYIWIATYGDGIVVFDPLTQKMVHKYQMLFKDCLVVLKASDGYVYAGTGQGLYQLDHRTDTFEYIPIVGKQFIHSLQEDQNKRLLVGYYYQGLGILDLTTGSFKADATFPSNGCITSMYRDASDAIWAATENAGVYKMVFASKTEGGEIAQLRHFDKSSGLPSNTIGCIIEDADGFFWIPTKNGLVEFDPATEEIKKIYLQKDKVIGSQFTFGSGFVSSKGKVYVGSNNGLLTFDPDYIREKFVNAKLHITNIGLIVNGSEASTQQDERSVITSQVIKVKQKDATYLTLSFSSMNYGSPNIESYDCTLSASGFNNKFTTVENRISYTNLRPGRYTFTVNHSGHEDATTEARLAIHITAPWYRSLPAKVLYTCLCVVLVLLIIHLLNKKKVKEVQRTRELEQARTEKELVHEKMDLLTNIAHEIRTPVSVLQILFDKISDENKIPSTISDEFNSMKLNIDNLKRLCNELLDFRKIENSQPMMAFANEDLTAICSKAISAFETVVKNKNLSLTLDLPSTPVTVYCDENAIESVICNLLSNAIKYCKSKISFAMQVEEDRVVIRMENDGELIPAADSESIFNAFYQVKVVPGMGTGLGLTYSKKIAELHQGRLYLDTTVKELNSFVFEIPKILSRPSQLRPTRNESVALLSDEDDAVGTVAQKTTVLVVEDNVSMRELIRDALLKDYNVQEAGDGEEALQIVQEGHIDLVVSDIMMPKMDGCALCNAIKEDIQLSHIPVLLLTAAVGIDTHIRSLKSGADAYIEKPFKMNVLKENINALFRNRDIRNRQFATSPLSHFSCPSISKIEQDFMSRLHNYIMEHLSETELTIGKLSAAMYVSKPTLTRKIKANTGLTLNEYVRICRLKRAVELLAEGNYRINEVAYLVGYSSPSYFTQSFQKQFGRLPSDFIKNA